MPFHELFGGHETLRSMALPGKVEQPCEECGRVDFQNRSATDEAALFFEDHEDLALTWHILIGHIYAADLVDALLELASVGLEDESAALAVLGELALSYYGLALRHCQKADMGLVGVPVERGHGSRN